MSKHIKNAIFAVIGLGLLASPAAAESRYPAANAPASNAESARAPDLQLGAAILGARVSTSGGVASLNFSAGATNVNRISTGTYEVFFNRVVSGCFYSAAGFFTEVPKNVEPRSGQPTAVFLNMQNNAGANTDSSFYLTVFCSK